jgi:hypothetical protein
MRVLRILCAVLMGAIGVGMAEEKLAGTEFIRIDEDAAAARLQTAVTTYTKGAVTVDLVGAIHIGDRGYYEGLNKRFADYEVLLFEMVGGENLVAGKFEKEAEEKRDPESPMDVLGDVYGMMTGALKLSGQKDEIDYGKKNFVHADLTLAEFANLQGEKDESVYGFALAAGIAAERANPEGKIEMGKVMAAMLSGNTNGLKLELMKTLGQGDDQLASFAGESVIIGDRNAKCLQVLAEEMEEGKKTIGIFYGAAHYPDMEERMLKQGFKKTAHEWLTAWDVAKPKAVAK